MKRTANNKLSESQEQTLFFNWAAYVPELKWAHAVPNGGRRDRIEAAHLKRQGVKAGVSDIFIPVPKGKYHGLYIEMKVKPNKPTDKQKEFLADMESAGYAAVVCYSADEAIGVTKEYLRIRR